MGNVQAASAVTGNPTSDFIVPPPIPSEAANQEFKEEPTKNPGAMEDLHKRCKGKKRLAKI